MNPFGRQWNFLSRVLIRAPDSGEPHGSCRVATAISKALFSSMSSGACALLLSITHGPYRHVRREAFTYQSCKTGLKKRLKRDRSARVRGAARIGRLGGRRRHIRGGLHMFPRLQAFWPHIRQSMRLVLDYRNVALIES